jgi:phosphopantothenoylcysteine decarboxylase/phosphopantothenate--cysteine ligase
MLPTPAGVELIIVETAQEMYNAALARFDSCSVAIGVAAVSDWRVSHPGVQKLSKADGPPQLHLEPTPDILATMGARKRPGQFLVGFSLETDPARLDSAAKLRSKNLDLLVANNPTAPGSEFGSDHNDALLIDRAGQVERAGLLTKQELAHRVLDRVAASLA